MRTVALDYGNRISMCEVSKGEVVARATVNTLDGLRHWVGPQKPQAQIAVEACREVWWVARRLREWGHEVLVVDTTRVKQVGVGHHRRKTDRIDAEVLAKALERGLLPKAHELSPRAQELRLHLSVRRGLIESRAQLMTTIRGLARARGVRLRTAGATQFARMVRGSTLGEDLRALVEPLLTMVEALDVQIGLTDRKLELLCAREPVIERLKTVPGVADVVAAAFVSVVDDAKRFTHAHQVEAYLGLVPSEFTSGRRRLGAITKQGNGYLRTLLNQAAWALLRRKKEDPIKQWGLGVLARRGQRVAVVAIARRLVGVLWALWRDGTVYEPARVGTASARGVALQAQSLDLQARAIALAARKPIRSSRRQLMK